MYLTCPNVRVVCIDFSISQIIPEEPKYKRLVVLHITTFRKPPYILQLLGPTSLSGKEQKEERTVFVGSHVLYHLGAPRILTCVLYNVAI